MLQRHRSPIPTSHSQHSYLYNTLFLFLDIVVEVDEEMFWKSMEVV